MVKFRQLIKPGNRGGDVTAVKNGMRRMHIEGSGALGTTDFAGAQFVKCVKKVQNQHNIHADGIYGKDTHRWVAPHFTARDAKLYETSKIRNPPTPPVPTGTAQENAKRLLQYHNEGKYHADNPTELTQIELTAEGKPVWSPEGRYLHIDARVMEVLVWLVGQLGEIGTFAMCSDHPYDGPHGHAGGLAVDISSVKGVSVAAHTAIARENTLKLAKLLHSAPGHLHPWQLICDGYGQVHDPQISALTIPNAAFYGYTTMSEHRNHVHCGYE